MRRTRYLYVEVQRCILDILRCSEVFYTLFASRLFSRPCATPTEVRHEAFACGEYHCCDGIVGIHHADGSFTGGHSLATTLPQLRDLMDSNREPFEARLFSLAVGVSPRQDRATDNLRQSRSPHNSCLVNTMREVSIFISEIRFGCAVKLIQDSQCGVE